MRTWWALLALAAAALAAGCLAKEKAADVPTIDVKVGRYHYEPGTESPIEVALGSDVVLRVTSTDVTHGFAIEGYGVQEEVPAAGTIEIRLHAGRAGDFRIYCTVFCGSGHPGHKGVLRVA